MRQKRNKKTGIIVLSVLAILFVIVTTIANNNRSNSTAEAEKKLPENLPVVAKGYKSDVKFEELYYIPETRYYYVKQISGKVTKDTADKIIKQLYSQEAWKDNGGELGNVLIYDGSSKVKKGQRPDGKVVESAEYSSKIKKIIINGEEIDFSPPLVK